MKLYTLGFIFSQNYSHVLLMHKNRPNWQAGKCNGVGGKCEVNETAITCISREVQEETHLEISEEEWIRIGEMKGQNWQVGVFTTKYKKDMEDTSSKTDEKVEWFAVNALPDNLLSNVPWLIEISLDKLKNNKFHHCTVYYEDRHD